VVHPNDRSRAASEWREVLKKGRSTEGELRVRRADGEFRWWFFRNVPLLDETGNIAKWYGTAVDIDDRKRAEEKLLASEQRLLDAQMELARVTRVTTLGELTATIAHEVDQPLAGLVANAEACLQWLDRDTPDLAAVRRSVEWVIEDGNRASEVISRVRALVYKTSFEKVPLDVNEVVRTIGQISMSGEGQPTAELFCGVASLVKGSQRNQAAIGITEIIRRGQRPPKSVPRTLLKIDAPATRETASAQRRPCCARRVLIAAM
jgi:C4-dicarboxylate-specific signal transduction histidine kinase